PGRRLDCHPSSVAGADCVSALGDLFERPRLELLNELLQAHDPLVVARLGPPAAHGTDRLPRPEAHERPRMLHVAEQPRLGSQTLAVAPLDPVEPTPDELVLLAGLDLPGRVSERGSHRI